MKKRFIKFTVLIAIVITLLCAVVLFLSNATWTDKNGFTHNTESSEYASDENASRAYAIVEMDKSLLDMSDHKFIETVTPVLEAYSDKYYTTFDFGDGTGLYFPGSDVNETAFYGNIDENGQITQQISYISVNGTQLTREEARLSASEASLKMEEYYPDEYKNDASWVTVADNILYLTIGIDENATLTDCAQASTDIYNIYINKGATLSEFDAIYISVNDLYAFKIDPKAEAFSITNDDTLLDKFAEIY